MHRYELSVLKALKDKGDLNLEQLVAATRMGRDEVMWSLENLKNGGMVNVEYTSVERITLSDEGKDYAKNGLPEERLVRELGEKGLRAADLGGEIEKIGLQWAKKDGLVEIENGNIKLTSLGKTAQEKGVKDGDALRNILKGNYSGGRDVLSDLIKRKLVSLEAQRNIKRVNITDAGVAGIEKGSDDSIDEVDRNIIATGSWKGKSFKKYDVNVEVERKVPAMRHPLKKLIDDLKDAYVSMGFQEVSGPAVESSFWTFDSLFVPQDHPARDAQDTFYVDNVDSANLGDNPYVKKVKKAHNKGWHAKWKEDVASQMLLRTHTTAVSSRQIYSLVEDIGNNPGKYKLPIKLFTIGRNFRNEALDYRHLADFYMHDGIIIGKDLTFSNLFDTLVKIYDFLGIKVKFKPSYFPFVEPGVEFMAYSEQRKEWIEIGGAGMVREEITGVKRSKLSVLAWGPGLDRILLIKDKNLSSIVELYNGNLGWVRNRKG